MLHNQTDRKFKLEIAVNNNQKTTGLIELDIPLTDRPAYLTPGFVPLLYFTSSTQFTIQLKFFFFTYLIVINA